VGKIVTKLIIVLVAASFMFLSFSNAYGLVFVAREAGKTLDGMTFLFFGYSILIFLLVGLFMDAFLYGGKDGKLLMTLPVSNEELCLSRFCFAYGYTLLLEVLLIIPLAIAFFLLIGFTSYMLVVFILIFFLLPLAPLSLGVLFSFIKIRYINGIAWLEGFVATAPPIIAVLLLSRGATLADQTDIQMSMYLPLFRKTADLFYFSQMSGALEHAFPCLVVFVSVSLLFPLLVLHFASGRFTYQAELYAQGRKKKKSKSYRQATEASSPLKALLRREMEIIRSDRGLSFEFFGELLIPVILIAVWLFMGISSQITSFLFAQQNASWFPGLLFCIISLFSGLCFVSATSVSRQGKLLKLDKVLPIEPKQVLRAKLYFHMLLVALPYLIYLSVFIGVAGLSAKWFVIFPPLLVINTFTIGCLDLALDYSRPMLDWDLPVKAMKSNPNTLIALLVNLIALLPSMLIVCLLPSFAWLAFIPGLCFSLAGYRIAAKATAKALSGD
jgi:ABC-2 type transport system permease protein